MRASVEAIFVSPFTEGFEGGIPYLYNDIEGKTTVAFGDLVDSVGAVLGLSWLRPDGGRASAAEIATAWQACHNDPAAARAGAGYAERLTTIRLTREAMTSLAMARFRSNAAELSRFFPDLEDWPACAQLAIASWAWAVGTHSPFPRLFSALRARDFSVASIEIHADEWTQTRDGKRIRNAGLVPRNAANRILMLNAQRVEDFKLDPDLLEWKQEIGVVDDAPTLPVLPSPEPEEVTGSGGVVHPLRYEPDEV